MSSTNKTTHYNLSQFLGTDKPAWLGDYNADMLKIDNGIDGAQSTATGADGKADANATNIGTLTSLTTTSKTDLVTAINEVNGIGVSAQNTANAANNTANTANTNVGNLAAYLDINSFIDNTSATSNNGSVSYQNMKYASNSTATFGKIYGHIDVNAVTAGDSLVTLATKASFRPDSDIIINDIGVSCPLNGNIIYPVGCTIKTDGTIILDAYFEANKLNRIIVHPCALFIKDFGD